MSGIQSKITRHVTNKKNMTHDKEFYQLIETKPEMTEMLEYAEKDTKTVL